MPKSKQLPIGFYSNNRGVFHRQSGEAPERIARRIELKATVSVAGSSAKFVILNFDDYDGIKVELKLPRADFLQFSRCKYELGNAGYDFPQNDALARRMHVHLKTLTPLERWEIVDRIGWHGNDYVLPNWPVQTPEGTILRFEPANSQHYTRYACKGTLDDWKNGVAAFAKYSSRLTLAISSGFAAPLLRFTDVEPGGFHLSGQSSKGKTTCLLAATSVSGPALRHELFPWNTSEAGLTELAAAHNDCLLCLEETAQISGDSRLTALKLRQATFMLAGGRGRVLSRIWGSKLGVRDLNWILITLSTGEQAMFELASEADVKRLKGEEVRLIDVPAIADDKLGIYESLAPEFSAPGNVSDKIVAECAGNCGFALRGFIRAVKKNVHAMPGEVRQNMSVFMKAANVPQDGWERRFAQRFALCFAAGAIAAKFGIVPWDRKTVGQQIRTCYLAARARVPDADQMRTDGFARLRDRLFNAAVVLDLTRSGHKVQWSSEDAVNAEAFRRSGPGGMHYLVASEMFVAWFVSEYQANLVLDALDERGALIKQQPKLRTIQVAISGISIRRRYYAIREETLRSI